MTATTSTPALLHTAAELHAYAPGGGGPSS